MYSFNYTLIYFIFGLMTIIETILGDSDIEKYHSFFMAAVETSAQKSVKQSAQCREA